MRYLAMQLLRPRAYYQSIRFRKDTPYPMPAYGKCRYEEQNSNTLFVSDAHNSRGCSNTL